jgi:hypothetical protein
MNTTIIDWPLQEFYFGGSKNLDDFLVMALVKFNFQMQTFRYQYSNND